MTAVVLAGGFGTRLRGVVADRPKPMALIKGRPFLEYLLDYWIQQNISRFIFSTGYLGHMIKNHFGVSYKNRDIIYSHEKTPLGTGGAIKSALLANEFLEENVIILNGDTWFKADLGALLNVLLKTGTAAAVCCKRISMNDRYGKIEVNEEGIISEFRDRLEYDINANSLINCGCYLVNRFFMMKCFSSYPQMFSFEKLAIPDLVRIQQVSASIQFGEFIDIGIPKDYLIAQELNF